MFTDDGMTQPLLSSSLSLSGSSCPVGDSPLVDCASESDDKDDEDTDLAIAQFGTLSVSHSSASESFVGAFPITPIVFEMDGSVCCSE